MKKVYIVTKEDRDYDKEWKRFSFCHMEVFSTYEGAKQRLDEIQEAYASRRIDVDRRDDDLLYAKMQEYYADADFWYWHEEVYQIYEEEIDEKKPWTIRLDKYA